MSHSASYHIRIDSTVDCGSPMETQEPLVTLFGSLKGLNNKFFCILRKKDLHLRQIETKGRELRSSLFYFSEYDKPRTNREFPASMPRRY